MEIICRHCKTKLNIPDGRIPKGQRISVACPRCKKKLTVDTREERPQNEIVSVGEPGGLKENPSSAVVDFSGDEDEALEYYEEGVKLALVMGNDREQIQEVGNRIETLGFKCVTAENTRKGIGKMRLNHFDVVIFPEDFGGVSLDQNPVLHFLNHLSMSIRRRMFVAILGRNFKTMEQMTAFALSANLVVNVKEIGQLPIILKRALSENERFYKVFMETYREVGRA